MEQKYPFDYENPYFYFRKEAAKKDNNFSSRTKAAKKLGVSAETLKAYETGRSRVPTDIVEIMCTQYKAHELIGFHCRYHCPIGKEMLPPIQVETLELDRLTLRLLKTFQSVSSARDSLIEIAADGVIDDSERPALDKILQTLDEISKHAQEIRVWIRKQQDTMS